MTDSKFFADSAQNFLNNVEDLTRGAEKTINRAFESLGRGSYDDAIAYLNQAILQISDVKVNEEKSNLLYAVAKKLSE